MTYNQQQAQFLTSALSIISPLGPLNQRDKVAAALSRSASQNHPWFVQQLPKWRRAIHQCTYFMNILKRLPIRLKGKIRRILLKLVMPIVREMIDTELQAIDDRLQIALNQRLTVDSLSPTVQEIINTQIRIWGDRSKLHLAPSAQMVNTLFNLSSGLIEIGDHTFTGHNVSIITGTHQYHSRLAARVTNVPTSGRDIIIGRGVWIGSNAIILGPCTIGDHAVIAAGAVITSGSDIPTGAIVAGIPAKVIKSIEVL